MSSFHKKKNECFYRLEKAFIARIFQAGKPQRTRSLRRHQALRARIRPHDQQRRLWEANSASIVFKYMVSSSYFFSCLLQEVLVSLKIDIQAYGSCYSEQ
jgi:hypothetical protein